MIRVISSEQGYSSDKLRSWGWIIKPILSALAIFYIFHKLNGVDYLVFIDVFISRKLSASIWFLAASGSIMLMFVNWGFEVVKWHLLIQPLYGTSIITSIKAILTGATTGIFTPNRLGEFVGRILALRPENRFGGTLLSFVNSLAQTVATVSFGILGFITLINLKGTKVFGDLGAITLQVLLILSWLAILFLYFRFKSLTEYLNQKSLFGKPLSGYTKSYEFVNESELQKLFGLSVLRFVSFILQYYLCFYMLSPEPAWIQIGGAAMLTMFSTTLFAFIPMPDLLLRQTMALSYFSLFEFDSIIVTQVVLLVWVVNVAVPAIAGAFVLFSYRIFRKLK